MANLKDSVHELNKMILSGRIIEALNTYYALDCTRQENDKPPTVGLPANVERERAFIAKTTWHGAEVQGVAFGEDVAMVEWYLDYTHTDWGRKAFHQVCVQRWKNGKVVAERSYHGG